MTGTVPAPDTTSATAEKMLIPPSVTMNDGIRRTTCRTPCSAPRARGHTDDGQRAEPTQAGQPERQEHAGQRRQRGDRQVDAAAQHHDGGARGQHGQGCRGVDHRGQAPLGEEARVGQRERDDEGSERDHGHERRHAGPDGRTAADHRVRRRLGHDGGAHTISLTRSSGVGLPPDGQRDLGRDPAVAHDDDPVGHADGLLEAVGQQQRGHPGVRELAHELVDLRARPDVQAARGVVEQEQPDVAADEPAGQDDLLLVAAGEPLDGGAPVRRADGEPARSSCPPRTPA